MQVLKPIFIAALLAIDIAGVVFAIATWVFPLLWLAMPAKPRSSLASVGVSIGIFVLAACLSVTGLSLAIVTLLFARGPNWAWLSLLTIVAFWLAGIIALNFYKGPSAGRKGTPK